MGAGDPGSKISITGTQMVPALLSRAQRAPDVCICLISGSVCHRIFVCLIKVALLTADGCLYAHLSRQSRYAMLLLMKHCVKAPKTSWQHAYVAAAF